MSCSMWQNNKMKLDWNGVIWFIDGCVFHLVDFQWKKWITWRCIRKSTCQKGHLLARKLFIEIELRKHLQLFLNVICWKQYQHSRKLDKRKFNFCLWLFSFCKRKCNRNIFFLFIIAIGFSLSSQNVHKACHSKNVPF